MHHRDINAPRVAILLGALLTYCNPLSILARISYKHQIDFSSLALSNLNFFRHVCVFSGAGPCDGPLRLEFRLPALTTQAWKGLAAYCTWKRAIALLSSLSDRQGACIQQHEK